MAKKCLRKEQKIKIKLENRCATIRTVFTVDERVQKLEHEELSMQMKKKKLENVRQTKKEGYQGF